MTAVSAESAISKIAGTFIKAILFLFTLALLAGPIVKSTTSFYDPGAEDRGQPLIIFMTVFVPSLAVAAALVSFFPSWHVLRVSLPILAALTLMAWAGLTLQTYFGEFAKFSDVSIRWSVLAMTPLGILAANAIIFFLARGRRPAVLSS